MRFAAVRVGHEIRQRYGMAELLDAPGRRGRHYHRPLLLHEAYGGPLPALRRPPRTRLRRWPEAYRPALLHERRLADVPPERALRGPWQSIARTSPATTRSGGDCARSSTASPMTTCGDRSQPAGRW